MTRPGRARCRRSQLGPARGGEPWLGRRWNCRRRLVVLLETRDWRLPRISPVLGRPDLVGRAALGAPVCRVAHPPEMAKAGSSASCAPQGTACASP